MAAYFLKQKGGQMSHLKLMKLLYLADREAMRRSGFPMSGDHLVSMPHGPVLSETLNLMDGDIESGADGWNCLISAKENNQLSLKGHDDVSMDDLDELSRADLEVLRSVWKQFGKMTRWEIRDYTHRRCPERKDPDGSSIPIRTEDIFLAFGMSRENAEDMAGRIEEQRNLAGIIAAS